MTDLRHRSLHGLDLFAIFKTELRRADRITFLADAGASLWPRFESIYRGFASLPRKARRALQRRWRRSLAGIALLHALGQVPAALAGQIDVDVGGCTLVDAITAANDDRPVRNCPAGGGPDTLTLPGGSTQTLASVNNSFNGFNGLPIVTSTIVITGNGSTIARIPTAPAFRILAVGSTGDLTLQETTITGGRSAPGEFATPGGGVLNNGTLALMNSTVSNNFTDQDGGGVYNTGVLNIASSTISGNSVGVYGSGGGVSNSGTLTLANSTVSGNSAVSFNGSGGGVHNTGTMVVTNSTISGNSTGPSYGYGGGIRNDGTLAVTNSTITANSAARQGGGLFNSANRVVTLAQTLVSGNSATEGPEVYNFTSDGDGIVNADAFNLFGHDGSSGLAGFSAGATDLVPSGSLSTLLNPTLADNGGPTETHALVSGSPAIDAVPAASCMTPGDQRGIIRPQDGNADTLGGCDIGAFELQLPPPPPPPPPPPDPLPPPAATPADENPKLRCVGLRCNVLIKCDAVQGSTEPCDIQIDVFVRRSTLRLGEEDAGQARRRIRFAAAVANVPANETANVRLRLTRRGRQIVRTSERRRLRGVMEIRNAVGPVQSVPVRIRLRR